MEAALVISLLSIGAVCGGLIVAAWYSDWTPPLRDLHSSPDNLESRSRRVQ